jgi:hypothetical protein
MANLQEDTAFTPGIYQLETNDPVMGGPNGINNLQAKQLAARTQWLKAQLAALEAEIEGHISATTENVSGGKSARLFAGADEIVSLPRMKAASGTLGATQGYGFTGNAGDGIENTGTGTIRIKAGNVNRIEFNSDGTDNLNFGSSNQYRLSCQSDGNVVLYVNNVARLAIDPNGSCTVVSPDQHALYVTRTGAGGVGQVIGSYEYYAKNSAGATLANHRIIFQQGSITAGSEGANIFYQALVSGSLRDYLKFVSSIGSLELNGVKVVIQNNGDLAINQIGAGVIFPNGVKQSAPAIGDGQTWQVVTRTANVVYQNTTGRAIYFAYRPGSLGGGFVTQVSTDGTTWLTVSSAGSVETFMQYTIIPSGVYYRVPGAGSTWELR